MSDFGERVRQLRKARRWTLKDLSARSGVSVSYLSDIERGRSANHTQATAERLSMAFEEPLVFGFADDLTVDERALINAYRAGDLRRAIQILAR